MGTAPAPLLSAAFPELARELDLLLRDSAETDLADQVTSLRILDRCRCGDTFCSTFYTGPRPEGAYPLGRRTVSLDPERGCLNVDVVDRSIVCVEVLDRDETRERLLRVCP